MNTKNQRERGIRNCKKCLLVVRIVSQVGSRREEREGELSDSVCLRKGGREEEDEGGVRGVPKYHKDLA